MRRLLLEQAVIVRELIAASENKNEPRKVQAWRMLTAKNNELADFILVVAKAAAAGKAA